MFKLEMESPDLYKVWIADKCLVCHSLEELLKVSQAFNIKLTEVETALIDLLHTDNDIAEFGVYGTFLYSKKKG